MSIINAMYTGVSGLDAESSDLNIIGNNISNANTIGFKQSRAVFDNVMGAIDPTVIGEGVKIGSSEQNFSQGSLLNTGVQSDLAISGDGFFVVQGSMGGVQGSFYTRAGQTSINTNGQLVNSSGLAFQGYSVGANGQMGSSVGPITLETSALAPKATTSVNVAANLSANTAVNGTFSTTITVYDSLGNGEPANLTFTKTANNAWSYAATVTTQDATGQSSTQSIGGGTLTFDPSSGNLTANTPTQTPAVTLPGSGATIPSITYDFGSASGSGTGGLTQSASDSVVSSQGQNGYTSGDLSGVQVGQDGTVSGVYSNGQTIAVGQLAIAKFPSNPGLTCAGNNLWIPSQSSGTPALGAAGAGGRGAITAGSLEQSNVDITAQFVDLIAQQRAFQADSKTITTADQMMQDLMQMKQ